MWMTLDSILTVPDKPINLTGSFFIELRSNPKLLLFCFTSLHNWSRKLARLSQLIRLKTETNRGLETSVFRTMSCLFLYWILIGLLWYIPSLWSAVVIIFGLFYDSQSKCALWGWGWGVWVNISLARRRKSHFELWQMEQRFQDSTGRPKILPKI